MSNISTMQKEMMVMIAENTPMENRSPKSNLNSVVAAISLKGGIQLAVASDAKGF